MGCNELENLPCQILVFKFKWYPPIDRSFRDGTRQTPVSRASDANNSSSGAMSTSACVAIARSFHLMNMRWMCCSSGRGSNAKPQVDNTTCPYLVI